MMIVLTSLENNCCLAILAAVAAGVGTTKSAMGQGLDDITKKIKEGRILDAVKSFYQPED